MERIWTVDLSAHSERRVLLAGWLHRQRQLSAVTFLILRDGKGMAQVVVEDAALRAHLAGLRNETVLQAWRSPRSARPVASSCATRSS